MDENGVLVIFIWTSAVEVIFYENMGCFIVIEWIRDSKIFSTSVSVDDVVSNLIDVYDFDGIEAVFNFLLKMVTYARPFWSLHF